MKDGIVAADSQSTAAFKRFDVVKIHRVESGPFSGWVFGGAGKLSLVMRMLGQIETGSLEPLEADNTDETSAYGLLVGPKLSYRIDSTSMIPMKFKGPYAIGSGEEFAMGAMLAGSTAADAVRIASKLDVYTGGPVRTLAVN